MIYTKEDIQDFFTKNTAMGATQKEFLNALINQKGNEFYVHALNYFVSKEDGYVKTDLVKITSYGFLYYVSLLKIDSLIDKNSAIISKDILDSFQFVEIAIKGLSSLYGSENVFWSNFDACKQQYYKGIMLENQLKNTDFECTQDFFEYLAECKSAFCYAYIYALDSLKKVENIKEKFEILRLIHVSMQYCDDIDDFIEDIKDGQVTYIYKEVTSFIKTKINLETTNTELLLKYVHVSWLSTKHLLRALNTLEKVKILSNNNKLESLSLYLTERISIIKSRIFEISSLNQKSISKSKQANETKNFRINDNNICVYVDLALNDGIKYLENWKNKTNHNWEDFLTSAGMGKTWITGFVLTNLYDIPKAKELYKETTESFNVTYNGLAGFHENLIADADSSNFYFWVKALDSCKQQTSQIQDWLKFMNCNGGWSTYIDKKGLINILKSNSDANLSGWLTAKNCVSAVSACVLSQYPELQNEYFNTCSYLKSKIKTDGSIESYWWTNDIYATAYTLIAFSYSSIYNKECDLLQHWLLAQINEAGFVIDTKTGEKSIFYTSLLVKALIKYDYTHNAAVVNLCINWILRNQFLDGSWKSTPILQIPDPSIDDIRTINKWKITPFGVNCFIEDHNRVFTTSLVINTINSFLLSTLNANKIC